MGSKYRYAPTLTLLVAVSIGAFIQVRHMVAVV